MERSETTNESSRPPAASRDASNRTEANLNVGDGRTPYSPSPPVVVQEDVPQDLFPVGKLVSEPLEREGEVSGSPRLELALETILTDLYRIPKWYLELHDVDDTEAIPRRGVMLAVMPITVTPQDCTLSDMAMDQEGRLVMLNVTVCPRSINGNMPRWFQDELEREFHSSLEDTRYHDRQGNFDLTMVSVDYLTHSWARNIARHFSADATVFVSLDDFTKIRQWTQSRHRT